MLEKRRALHRLVPCGLLYFMPTVSAQMNATFAVGIVDAGGNLVPVATFDGASWSTPWPADFVPGDDAPSWPDLPESRHPGGALLRDWTLWFENPGATSEETRPAWDWVARLVPRSRALVAGGLVMSETQCSRNLALSTDAGDFRDSLTRAGSCPDAKRGLATTGTTPPRLVERLDPDSDAVRKIAAGVRNDFDGIESRAVERWSREFGTTEGRLSYTGQWLEAGRRNKIPLRVNEAFRIREAAASIYYLEIVRDYGNTADATVSCPGYSYLRTWILIDESEELVPLEQDFNMPDCDMKEALFDIPIVFWKLSSGIHLLVERGGWESQDYLILTIDEGVIAERTEIRFQD